MTCSYKFFFWLFIASFSIVGQAVGQTQDQEWLAVSDLIPIHPSESGIETEANTLEAFQVRHKQLTLDMEREVKTLKDLLHEAYLVQVEKATAGEPEEFVWNSLQEKIQATEQRIAQLQMSISDNELTYYFMMQEIEALEEISDID